MTGDAWQPRNVCAVPSKAPLRQRGGARGAGAFSLLTRPRAVSRPRHLPPRDSWGGGSELSAPCPSRRGGRAGGLRPPVPVSQEPVQREEDAHGRQAQRRHPRQVPGRPAGPAEHARAPQKPPGGRELYPFPDAVLSGLGCRAEGGALSSLLSGGAWGRVGDRGRHRGGRGWGGRPGSHPDGPWGPSVRGGGAFA